jgi:hypothetical protein
MGTTSVSRVDTAATRDVVLDVAPCAVRRCSANSFPKSNLLCAWLDAEDRASTAQKQATRVVIRGAARTPRRCGDGSLRRIAISLVVFGLTPESGPQTNRECLETAISAREQLNLAELCPSEAFPSTEKLSHEPDSVVFISDDCRITAMEPGGHASKNFVSSASDVFFLECHTTIY